ncbi:uncharacterized protein LOC132716451 isoform X6 [Ruditapes philippinarum]|uniref:uncharacterized protein LOC132716451 isoform X6 n=1 Tax=Ruditapes philippinarum TaxID=129788 RepID=UPI00295AB370|nr:uncharacterized protein LOC132716451 isoform X6 [Ruditapes philippinarum]
MGLNETSVFIKVSFCLAAAGFLLHIIGFATAYWISSSVGGVKSHQGLWRGCVSGNGYSICSSGGDQPSWFEATQAFETLGFIAAIVALVLIVLYVFVPQTSGKKIVFILAMLACFAAAGCIILGIIIYGSKMDNLSWSFALCCIAGIIFGISGILLVVDMLKR